MTLVAFDVDEVDLDLQVLMAELGLALHHLERVREDGGLLIGEAGLICEGSQLLVPGAC